MKSTEKEQNFSFPDTKHKLVYVKLHINEFHGFLSSFLVAMRSAAGGRFPRRVAHSDNLHSHNRGGRETKKEDGKFPSHPPACVSSCVQRGCR